MQGGILWGMGTEQSTDGMERISELLQASDDHLAVMRGDNAGSPYHLVDTTTFDNHWDAPPDYEGHAASIGKAEALCGTDPFGRMLPEDVTRKSRLCGNCLRLLKSETEASP